MSGRALRQALLLGAAAALIGAPALAQGGNGPEHSYETWLGGFFSGPIAGRLFFQGDLHYRAYDDLSPHFALLRPGLALRLHPGMFAALEYAWTPLWLARGAERFTDEHRLTARYQWDSSVAEGALLMQLRTRLELRWRENNGSDTGLRLRQMVRAAMPFGADRRWLAVLWDELFVQLNDTDWGQRPGFDQNRLFLGVGRWMIPAAVRVEAGYFNQYIQRVPAADLWVHALMVNTYVIWQ